ncbi:hypothetical protein N7457_004403 [Penicillium paradoxum]|uniref:uncharacterized protein n=1 Tax=Penicillium paradoxum TaxID=176176 RepID=UPI0025471E37|nr:uncharacterized protein N7457_004403 [Penicillium paradoxum]KAJ5782629.1 hypothetical protein N7457_004403 [Penicillium paradoxum]
MTNSAWRVQNSATPQITAIFRTSWLLVALQALRSSAATPTLPEVLEVDLIFPRNDTFAPTALTPVVFAVQNSDLISILDLQLSWNIRPISSERWGVSDGMKLNLGETYNDTYFVHSSTEQLNMEGIWRLSWTLSFLNCTSVNGSAQNSRFGIGDELYFSTRNDTQAQDLAAATEEGTCAKLPSSTLNVTRLLDASGGDYPERSSCAAIPSSAPEPSPCKVKMDSAAALSLSASITATACARTGAMIKCSGAASGVQSSIWKVCVPAILGWLAHNLV